MAFFGGSKSETKAFESKTPTVPSAPKAGTAAITGCMEILGNVKACGTVHVDGKIHGDLTTDGDVIIGKEGVVNGDASGKKVILSGKINGNVVCESLEVTQTGKVSDTIQAQKVVCDGTLESMLSDCDLVHITKNGKVTTKKMMAKHIIVNGEIEGNVVATELLEINQDGRVKGEMQVKKIKVSEGGLMLGTMLTYEPTNPVKKVSKSEPVEKNGQAEALKKIVNADEKKDA